MLISCKLNQLVANYLAVNKRITESTADLTSRSFREFIELAGNAEIDKITIDDVEIFQAYLVDKGLSKTSANICCKTISPVFSWAVKKGLLEKNPFLSLKKFKIMPKPVITYSREELGRLLFYADDLWKARILLGASTLRKSEVLNLTVSDIDFENMMIKIQEKQKTLHTWAWRPKDNERRSIPLIAIAVPVLLTLIEAMPAGQPYVCLTTARYQYLMMKRSLSYRQRYEPDNNFERNYRALCRRAAISGKTFHELRKTGLTNLTANMRLQEVKEIAGHSDLKTTERYLAKRPDFITRASDLLNRGVAQFG
jgi:integrase/recombinase XerC